MLEYIFRFNKLNNMTVSALQWAIRYIYIYYIYTLYSTHHPYHAYHACITFLSTIYMDIFWKQKATIENANLTSLGSFSLYCQFSFKYIYIHPHSCFFSSYGYCTTVVLLLIPSFLSSVIPSFFFFLPFFLPSLLPFPGFSIFLSFLSLPSLFFSLSFYFKLYSNLWYIFTLPFLIFLPPDTYNIYR